MGAITTEIFIQRARAIHGDKYDYSKVEYVNISTKVCIICPVHGEFWQAAHLHLEGRKCPKCAGWGIWDRSSCYEEAKKYQSRKQFQKGSIGAYTRSLKNGWIDDYTWFAKPISGQHHWTYEACKEEALRYDNLSSFREKSNTAYTKSIAQGWLEDFTWLGIQVVIRSGKKIYVSKKQVVWNKETCFEEAKKYATRRQFKLGCSGAYNRAKQEKWLDDYTWFKTSSKPQRFWTEETCREEARKYKTRTEFANNASTAYHLASKNKWIDQYDWFVPKGNSIILWTYEKCYAIAKQFSSKKEFLEKEPNAYHKASHSKWLDSFDWLSTKFVWTYELCYNEALKYEKKKVFHKDASGAYEAALRNGWLKDYTWMADKRVNILTDKIDTVYAYYFEKYNAIYVGRTVNLRRRDHEHILNVDNDTVARFAHEKKCAVPPMIILEKNLTIAEGQEREDYWVKHYTALGYNILNNAKTGLGIGSLGSILAGKWSREKCYNEAKKYTSRKEFQIESVGAYTRALKRGWLDDYTWFSAPKTGQRSWTYEACYEEAQRYTTLSAFRTQSSTAYTKAHKKGWLIDYTWLGVIIVEKNGTKYHVQEGQVTIWNRESCYDDAKKYTTRKQFQIGSAGAYSRARQEGWLDDYTWFVNGHAIEGQRRKKWDYEKCYEEAKKYHSRKEFQYGKGSGTAYKTARANGWLDDYTWFRTPPKPDGYWTYERCYEVARKYSYMADFKKENPSVDVIARRNGWIKDYTWLIKKKKHWSYDECAAYAKRHQKASQFKLACPSAYVAAVENNWLKEFFPADN